MEPFVLVIPRPSPALELKLEEHTERSNTAKEARDTWKSWLETDLRKTKGKLDQTQARYKRNYEARLRRQTEEIAPEDWVYLHVERGDERKYRNKLSAVAEGPYNVNSTQGNTVVINRRDGSVERVSQSREVLEQGARTLNEIHNTLRPPTDA